MSLNKLQKLVFEEYKKNAYLDMWNFGKLYQNYIEFELKRYIPNLENIFDIAELGLISTEVSEGIEVIRQNGSTFALILECADIIIRTLNFMSRKGYSATDFILLKHNLNLERGLLHGKKV